MRSLLFFAGGALAIGLAVVAFLFAADVGSLRGALAGGDVGYPARSANEDPWAADTIMPFGAGASLLGVEDDLAYRRALRLFRLGAFRLTRYGPEILTVRAEAQARLAEALRADPDPARRAREANLLGVVFLVSAASGTSGEERRGFYTGAAANFVNALRLEPALEDAKYNLELTLIRDPSIHVSAKHTGNQRARVGHGAGIGGTGSGY